MTTKKATSYPNLDMFFRVLAKYRLTPLPAPVGHAEPRVDHSKTYSKQFLWLTAAVNKICLPSCDDSLYRRKDLIARTFCTDGTLLLLTVAGKQLDKAV